ncbi:hypothetical protein L6164_010270 [Bauhinia variegata]|uniref:Uncharacterized protein n=1 Tax=Bauhinia variegata TaxID=167791 RepID=A0ACB9PME6_BAUVA|nr:hypothetical protein L6164_010270 [Bauhinia variegata]
MQRQTPSLRKQSSYSVKRMNFLVLRNPPMNRDRKGEVHDDRDYYKHHKASPLSELEITDSRKPITRATDGTVESGDGFDEIIWLPEQLDTAEEALKRATEI